MILNFEPPRYAREHGVNLMTFDNVSELEKIEMYFPEAKLVMRIAPDDSHSLMRFGTKFGVHPDDCADLLEMASEMKLAVVGVRCESSLFFFPLLVLTYFSFLFFSFLFFSFLFFSFLFFSFLFFSFLYYSFHVGSGCFNEVAYSSALTLVRKVFDDAKKAGIELELVDIGGGFSVCYT